MSSDLRKVYLAEQRRMAEARLRDWAAHSWTLQGFGMLRLHLPDNHRLHIWDSRYRVPGVSDIHDHMQWGFKSTVIAGELLNQHYHEVAANWPGSIAFDSVTLKPGVGTHFKDEVRRVWLVQPTAARQRLVAGDSYRQAPREIHSSHPVDGTVTLMQKFPTGDDSARVFWPAGGRWVSAEPRPATPEEVDSIVSYALRRWFA
jgi:hypothetical protein